MGVYIVFFGKSQDFTSHYYDSIGKISNFDSVIKDFELLESKIFTIDDIKNKEILSRYFFNSQGKSFCLLKLYSFAQAYDGNRIAGSIYGVGLISDNNINLSNENLGLLRAAKDKFAELSLNGSKFNKSDFETDTDKIWKAISNNKNINLIDNVKTSQLTVNNTAGQSGILVSDLIKDAIKLDNRLINQDKVYLSEDLDHLKRTQEKWGKDIFPIYWEQNNQFVVYKEPEIIVKPTNNKDTQNSDNSLLFLRSEINELEKNNLDLKLRYEKQKKELSFYKYIALAVLAIIIILTLYFQIKKFFFSSELIEHRPILTTSNSEIKPIETPFNFIQNKSAIDTGILFLKSAGYILEYNPNTHTKDTSILTSQHSTFMRIAKRNKIDADKINIIYLDKRKEISLIISHSKITNHPIIVTKNKTLNKTNVK